MRSWRSDIAMRDNLLVGAGENAWDGNRLQALVEAFCTALEARSYPHAPVAILADNSPQWIAADLASQDLGIALVPLPAFFTAAQMRHAIEESGAQAIFCKDEGAALQLGFASRVPCDSALPLYEARDYHARPLLKGIQKITFTSGTTSQPKGVCLDAGEQWHVADAIYDCIAHIGIKRHLCLLPLSVLLENIGGVYVAMRCGASIACPPLSETGLGGASRFDPHACLEAIQRYEAESVILLPQMLQALVAAADVNDERIRTLKFAAAGGARTPAALIRAARDKGFPAYEGYGLSECASVVALNVPGKDRIGSAGQPLPGRMVRVVGDGEIEVRVSGSIHYLGDPPSLDMWLPTGDLGHLDAEGFLHIDGRKKNVLITAFGRNVSPEWPESTLLGTGVFAQAVVLGDARPYLVALVVPASARHDPGEIRKAVEQANCELPDYAQIRQWIAVPPFTLENSLATANGRPRRELIGQRYRQQINALYEATEEIEGNGE